MLMNAILHAIMENVLPCVLGVGLLAYGIQAILKYVRKDKLRKAIALRAVQRSEHLSILESHLKKLEAVEGAQWELIWNASFDALLELLRSESVRPVVALHAFQWAALAATEATNCVTMFFPEADAAAAQLHDDWAGKDPKPRLYGLPVSIKENIKVKCHDSTVGFAAALFQPMEEDAVVVAVLRGEGAVPFCATNLPQAAAAFSSANPVYGNTSNPYAVERTAGGSSGGEGALVALGGSPLGIGSDIGGSIRVPAHFCGIAGFKESKATSGRMTATGTVFALSGVQAMHKAAGPMAKEVAAVVALQRVFWSPPPNPHWTDPLVVPLPFNEAVFADKRALRIGFYVNDGACCPTPPMRRALWEAQAVLSGLGHELVPWCPPRAAHGWLCGLLCTNPDGYTGIANAHNDIPEPMHARALREDWAHWFNRCVLPPNVPGTNNVQNNMNNTHNDTRTAYTF